MTSSLRSVIPVFLFALLAGFSVHLAAAETDEKVEPVRAVEALFVEPESVSIARFKNNAVATAIVVAKVSGATQVPDQLELTFTVSPGLKVEIGQKISADGDVSWPVRVQVSGDPPDDARVNFRLALPAADRPAGPPVSKTELHRAELEIKVDPKRNASPAGDVELSIKADEAAVTESIPLRAYLSIGNKSEHALTLTRLAVEAPQFLSVAPERKTPITIDPHQWLQVPLAISIRENEKPKIGKWLVLASATLARGAGDFQQKGMAVVETTVQVGVAGVSDVLKVLNLPSLLIVPGALIVATWSLFFGTGGTGSRPGWLEWKSSSFWLVAITLSILTFGILSWFKVGPDFLAAFGVRDVALMWLGCVGFGVLSYGVYAGGKSGLASISAWREEKEHRSKTPQTDDQPADILRKLNAAGLAFYIPQESANKGGQKQDVYKLGFEAPNGTVWAVPKMLLAQMNDSDEAKKALKDITRANNNSKKLQDLIDLLSDAMTKKLISLDWEEGAVANGPVQMPAATFKKSSIQSSPLHYA